MERYLCTMALILQLVGCSSVSVIQPVAKENVRNAQALQENVRVLIDADRQLVDAVLQNDLISYYKGLIKAVLDQKPPTRDDYHAAAKYYKDEADKFRGAVDKLGSAAREQEIIKYENESPLTAEVAFNGMQAEVAAAKWLEFNAIHENTNLTSDQKFVAYENTLRTLKSAAAKERADTDSAAAYEARVNIIMTQAAKSKDLADQLLSASMAGADPGKFLVGVTQNTQLIQTIGDQVLKNTNDPKRKQAAEQLLNNISAKPK